MYFNIFIYNFSLKCDIVCGIMKEAETNTEFHFVYDLSLSYPFENVEYFIKHGIYSSHHNLNIQPGQSMIEVGNGIVGTCEKCQSFYNVTTAALAKVKETKDMVIRCNLNDDCRSASISVYHPSVLLNDARCPLQDTKYLIQKTDSFEDDWDKG